MRRRFHWPPRSPCRRWGWPAMVAGCHAISRSRFHTFRSSAGSLFASVAKCLAFSTLDLRLGFAGHCAEFFPFHQRFAPFLFGNDAADVAGDTAELALVPGDMPVWAGYVGCRLCGGCGHSLAVFYGAKIRKFRRSGTFSYMIRSGEGPAVLSPLPCSGVCRCQSLTSGRVL